VRLAGEVFSSLGNAELTLSVYRKALEVANDYPALEKILEALTGDYQDEALAGDVITKVIDTTEEAAELLAAATWSEKLLQGNELTCKLLDLCEESVKALDDLRKLVRTAGSLTSDDETRLLRLKAKLEKREASQVRYVEFQDREKTITKAGECIALAAEVMEELEDASYTSKLLQNASELIDAHAFELQQYLSLTLAVDGLVKDADWVVKLLTQCAENCHHYAQVRALGRCAAQQLSNREEGIDWTRALYANWEATLTNQEPQSSYEFGKLAVAIRADISDSEWAMKCIESARNCSTDHFQLLHLAATATQWEAPELAADLYREAAGRCTTAEAFIQLVQKLKTDLASEPLQRKLYKMGQESLAEPTARLRWAEGVLQLFGDREWATEVYQSLEGDFSEASGKALYKNSLKTNLNSLR